MMKLEFKTADLLAAVKTVSAALDARSPRPALQCIHMEPVAGGVAISASNMEMCIRARIPGTIDGDGPVLIHGTRLVNIVREIVAEDVSISADGSSPVLRAGRSRFTLCGQSAEQFPDLPSFDFKPLVTVPGCQFAALIKRASFAACAQQGRYAINSVCLDVARGTMDAAATDGKRLAVASLKVGGKGKLQALIPPRAAEMIAAAAQDIESVALVIAGGRVLARAGDTIITAAIVDGTFPAYRNMVPKAGNNPSLTVDRGEWARALRQVAAVTTADSYGVTMAIAPDKLTLFASSANIGEGEVDIPCTWAGDERTIGFQPALLLDGLSHLDGDASIEIPAEGSSPMRMSCDGFVYVVAPMNIRKVADEDEDGDGE